MEALLTESSVRISVAEAYERCERLAKTHYENFNVGSRLLPGNKRKHFYAIYAFCRFVDDLGDEFEGDRLRALDYWEEEVEDCFSGSPSHPYMVAVQDTIRSFDIPREPFLRLIEANRMDQTTKRYATYRDLEHYCHHSANPVGHLVLVRVRLPRRGAPETLRLHLYSPAARELLAGRGPGLRHGPDLHTTGGHGPVRVRRGGACAGGDHGRLPQADRL